MKFNVATENIDLCYNIHMTNILHKSRYILMAGLAVAFVASLGLAAPAQATPPQVITYVGTPVKTGVPGKTAVLKLKVTNSTSDNYANISVIFHIPDTLTLDAVSPGSYNYRDGILSWDNVPLEAHTTFSPTLTLKIPSGTAVGKKLNVWAEVTGKDMEGTSQNFPITTVKKVAAKTTLTSADVKSLFQQVYGRTPTAKELAYWVGRRADKPTAGVLKGAIQYHKDNGISHK